MFRTMACFAFMMGMAGLVSGYITYEIGLDSTTRLMNCDRFAQCRQTQTDNTVPSGYRRWDAPDMTSVPRIDSGDILTVLDSRNRRTVVGAGGSSTAYLCQLVNTGERCVVKFAKAHVSIADFYHEAEVTWLLASSGVTPRFHGLLMHGGVMLNAFVAGHVRGTSLLELLDGRPTLSPDDVFSIALGISTSLRRLHMRGIFHGDIKEDNIFIDWANEEETGVFRNNINSMSSSVYFIDFGQSARFNESYGYKISKGFREYVEANHPYVAPEILEGSHFSDKSDIHALGHIYEVMAGMYNVSSLHAISRLCKDYDVDIRPNIDELIDELRKFA